MLKIKNLSLVVFLMLLVLVSIGCGSSSVVSSDATSSKTTNFSIVPDSIKTEKQGDNLVITYKTSTPTSNNKIITSNFSFNNAPLWTNVYDVKTSDGLNHMAVINEKDAKHFMIYAGPGAKYDNNGKGIEIK